MQEIDASVEVVEAEEVEEEESDCCHHWVIESPNGPTSNGVCKVCGVIRAFKNSIQVTSWESDGNHLHRSQPIPTASSL